MDYHHLELKYFLQTIPHENYLIHVCPNIHMIERKAVPEAGVELNESLLNRRLVILYRHTEWGCRWRSQCMVQAVLQRHRSAAGQVETLELKREDDTSCLVGLHMGDYWSHDREMDDHTLLWYLVR